MYFYGYRQYEPLSIVNNLNIMSYNSACIELFDILWERGGVFIYACTLSTSKVILLNFFCK